MARKAHRVDITMLYSPRGVLASSTAPSRSWLRRVALSGIRTARFSQDQPVQIGLVVADDETLQRLNREYRGSDEMTDVLSFSWEHEGHWEGDDEPSEETGEDVLWPVDAISELDCHPLGEVIVSYPQAERQAQARGVETDQELALLIVHGILHLSGFDHVEPLEEAQMKAKESEALDRIFKQQSHSTR